MLSANSSLEDELCLAREYRQVYDVLRQLGCAHQLIHRPGAMLADIPQLLLEHERELQIVHFSGHGVGGGLLFDDAQLPAQGLRADALVDLLAMTGEIEGVVLNACDSAALARQVSEQVGWAIGVEGQIRDEAAILFSTRFYGCFATGKGVEWSTRWAEATLRMAGFTRGHHQLFVAGSLVSGSSPTTRCT